MATGTSCARSWAVSTGICVVAWVGAAGLAGFAGGCSSSPASEFGAAGANSAASGGAGASKTGTATGSGASPSGANGAAAGAGEAGVSGSTATTGTSASTGAEASTGTDGGGAADAIADSTADDGDAMDATVDSSGPGDANVDQNALPNVTLWLVGDSTVAVNTTGTALEGWGQEIGQYFSSKVTVDDRAQAGRSVETFMYSDLGVDTVETARWATLQADLKPGDFLTVQFGANDSDGIAGRAVTPANFEVLLGRMIDLVRAKGATPILVTPSALQIWVNGMETNTRLAPYVAAMLDLGSKKSVQVDDLNARSVAYISSLGQTAAQQAYYMGDKAHFTKYGATQFSRMVTEELRRINSPLAAYLK